MRIRSLLLVAACLALAPRPSLSQGSGALSHWQDSSMVSVQAAVVAGDVNALSQARAMVERALTAYPNDAWLSHYLGYALYREAVLRQGVRGTPKEDIAKLLEASQHALEASVKADPKIPENHALLAQVVGLRISVNPESAMLLGEVAEQELTRATQLGPNNPRVAMIQGVNALFTPAEYGGGPVKARALLNHAIELFPADHPRSPAPAWGKAETYGWLGVLDVRERNFDAARAKYASALAAEPGYAWIKERLLPGMERMAAQKPAVPATAKTP
jgi:tetratricopeptide (TPR) repeat protein